MSVKKMDEVPEKKTESKILAKMGKKEQGRCQKESVVLKNGQSTDNGKHVTVRVQRIRKIHIKQKLIIFSVLAVCLVVLAVFSDHLCPYDPYAQDLSSAQIWGRYCRGNRTAVQFRQTAYPVCR